MKCFQVERRPEGIQQDRCGGNDFLKNGESLFKKAEIRRSWAFGTFCYWPWTEPLDILKAEVDKYLVSKGRSG